MVSMALLGTGWYLTGIFMGLWCKIPPFGARCLQREGGGSVELERGRGMFLPAILTAPLSEKSEGTDRAPGGNGDMVLWESCR